MVILVKSVVQSVAYSEVIWIHLELFVVQAAQISVYGPDYHLAMGCYFGVIQNSSGREDITKCAEITLGPGVHDQNSVNIKGILLKFSNHLF
uniref:Uncharacterized protein n=1 Tax=Mastacembelus armatus TaxID=205130 RepID=A0A3Q3KU17_9TELE